MPDVVVADVVPLVRAGLSALLDEVGYTVVACERSARDLAKAVIEHTPALVVVGVVHDLPVAEMARQVREGSAGVRLVVMLNRAPRDTLADLLAVDVDGLLSRAIESGALVRAIERVMEGERYIDPQLLAGDVPDEDLEPTTLTAREREVLGLLATGSSNREIASALFVSLPTVKTHLAHIYEKLEAGNRNEALGRAMSLGLLA
ncbi:MAG: response regulator transcription factor [Acidimicrobiia bacterium]|nr:response regulator transcription factor [Acidimicrobiia bacterium]